MKFIGFSEKDKILSRVTPKSRKLKENVKSRESDVKSDRLSLFKKMLSRMYNNRPKTEPSAQTVRAV